MTFSIHTTLCLNKTNPFLVKDEEVFSRSFPSITFDQNLFIANNLQNIAFTQNLFTATNKLQNITFNEREVEYHICIKLRADKGNNHVPPNRRIG